jgi:cytochrome P450
VELAPGDLVEVVMASANRDERRFERPDEFDLDHPRQAHMAFGNGEHLCSGHYFSGQLERIALEELLAGRSVAAPRRRARADRGRLEFPRAEGAPRPLDAA